MELTSRLHEKPSPTEEEEEDLLELLSSRYHKKTGLDVFGTLQQERRSAVVRSMHMLGTCARPPLGHDMSTTCLCLRNCSTSKVEKANSKNSEHTLSAPSL